MPSSARTAGRARRVGEFGLLFISLLAVFVVPELLPDEGRFQWQVPLFITIVMLAALRAVSMSRSQFWFAAILLVFAVVPEWLGVFGVRNTLVVGRVLSAVFLGYLSVLILRSVLSAQTVDHEVILGALCVYLMFALIWGVLYQLIETSSPGSFLIPPALFEDATNPQQAIGAALHYFSFVTLTTLGYGDVQPVAPLARSFAMIEALIGQIYLVTLIARLVSVSVVHKQQREPDRTE